MAVAIIIDFKGGTLDQYDEVVEKMDLGGKTAPGGLFHWACKTDDGFRVVDVWEDRAEFEETIELHASTCSIRRCGMANSRRARR